MNKLKFFICLALLTNNTLPCAIDNKSIGRYKIHSSPRGIKSAWRRCLEILNQFYSEDHQAGQRFGVFDI